MTQPWILLVSLPTFSPPALGWWFLDVISLCHHQLCLTSFPFHCRENQFFVLNFLILSYLEWILLFWLDSNWYNIFPPAPDYCQGAFQLVSLLSFSTLQSTRITVNSSCYWIFAAFRMKHEFLTRITGSPTAFQSQSIPHIPVQYLVALLLLVLFLLLKMTSTFLLLKSRKLSTWHIWCPLLKMLLASES